MTETQIRLDGLAKMLRKLDSPPAGPNWVRFYKGDVARTAREIVKFAKGQPLFNYLPGYKAIKDRIELGIDLNAAIKVATSKGAPAGRAQNRLLVEAFFAYDAVRRFSAANPVEFETEFFRISRDVLIPVAPVSIIRERGKFVPIFVCGWAENPLILVQRRLLMTIYEDAFFSLTDFQSSSAEVLFFPKSSELSPTDSRNYVREAEIWHRGDYELLSKDELDGCVEIFILAREVARKVLLDEIDQLREKAKSEAGQTQSPPPEPDLFTR